MINAIISSKNQMVVPKEIRQKLGIKSGQRLYLDITSEKSFTVSTQTAVDKYYGSLKTTWQEDPVIYQQSVRQQRGQK